MVVSVVLRKQVILYNGDFPKDRIFPFLPATYYHEAYGLP